LPRGRSRRRDSARSARWAVEAVSYTFETKEDLDFDGQPDGWTRRKGENFPNYVTAKIDDERGHGTSKRSLKFEVNGGAAAMYSSPVHIDSLHAYVFRCRVRTQALQNNAAVVSVSLLNEKRQRIQRVLSAPVTGSHADWVEITLGPIAPLRDVRLLTVGCHLVPGKAGSDISGAIWFDDLWVGKVPQLSLDSNFQTQFREPNAKVKVTAHATGPDPQRSYTLQLEMSTPTRSRSRRRLSSRAAGRCPNRKKGTTTSRPCRLLSRCSGASRAAARLL
jgi:hypothetical protein